jgi:D-alanine-D-alanine ligase
MRIAVVRNRENNGVIAWFGQVSPEVYSAKTIQSVITALRAGGHLVAEFEGDKNLLAQLEAFLSSDGEAGPGGIVFNMAYGIQGESRYTHVPAMLEMAGVPYTGSGPLGHSIALDKVVTKDLLVRAGVPTPNYMVLRRPEQDASGLRFPLVVKPRHESTSYGLRLVRSQAELSMAVEAVVAQYHQDALVEEYIEGREICVALLGNEEMEFLPLVEADFGVRQTRLVTFEDKYHLNTVQPEKICPAPVDEALARKLREISRACFDACYCKDYARVDIRIDSRGDPYVLEINSMASLGASGSYVCAAMTAGYTYEGLVNRILEVARQRYGRGTGLQPVQHSVKGCATTTPLIEAEIRPASSALPRHSDQAARRSETARSPHAHALL